MSEEIKVRDNCVILDENGERRCPFCGQILHKTQTKCPICKQILNLERIVEEELQFELCKSIKEQLNKQKQQSTNNYSVFMANFVTALWFIALIGILILNLIH